MSMQFQITGSQLIGFSESAEGTNTFKSFNPQSNAANPWTFHEATNQEVQRAMELSARAFESYRNLSPGRRGAFLKEIAQTLEAYADAIVLSYTSESGLPEGRARGELGRTTGQLRSFAQWIEEGSWVQARIDTAQPNRQPIPKPDIRKQLEPLGPVIVFGASNFPLAFSTAGGDTASALAAGCPVVVKGHPMHPATGELVARCILRAARECAMPEGVFSHLQGSGHALGTQLVMDPNARAVAFTGSQKGGLALAKLAQQREIPIPLFAEMGSVNPVVLLPAALSPSAGWAKAYAGSVTLGAGQFCTNPGLLLGIQGADFDVFISDLATEIAQIPASCMLHASIVKNYQDMREALLTHEGVQLITSNSQPEGVNQVAATVAAVSGTDFIRQTTLQEEVFGPFTLVVKCADASELEKALAGLQGQLTATVIGSETDMEQHKSLIAGLRDKVGRILFNGVPTGVEVCPSMQHGGPYPATTDGRFTSVGNDSLLRWVRPVSYQNCPSAFLPEALQDANPLGILRWVDGAYHRNTL